MNLNTYNDPDYQKKMAECIEQYDLIDKLTERAEAAEAEVAKLKALCAEAEVRCWPCEDEAGVTVMDTDYRDRLIAAGRGEG